MCICFRQLCANWYWHILSQIAYKYKRPTLKRSHHHCHHLLNHPHYLHHHQHHHLSNLIIFGINKNWDWQTLSDDYSEQAGPFPLHNQSVFHNISHIYTSTIVHQISQRVCLPHHHHHYHHHHHHNYHVVIQTDWLGVGYSRLRIMQNRPIHPDWTNKWWWWQ